MYTYTLGGENAMSFTLSTMDLTITATDASSAEGSASVMVGA